MSNTSLVVDDNSYNRVLARLVLENAGYTVAEAENGVIALQMLAIKTYDLLILDLAMPALGGLGVLAEIRKSTHHNPIKVIIMTARHKLAAESGMEVDYLMYKPIDIQIFKVFLRGLKSPETAVR